MRRGLGKCGCSVWRKKRLWHNPRAEEQPSSTLKRLSEIWTQAPHNVAWKRVGDNKHKLKQERVKLDIKRNFSTVRTVKHCNRGPGWLCNIRSWKLSIASWIKPCPTLSDPRAAPALSSSLVYRYPEVPSNLSYPVIL